MSKTSTDNKTKSTESPNHAKCLPNIDYVKKMRGELYEKISSAKIFKDFYLEDIAYPSKKITQNFQMTFDKLKDEIAPLLIIGERPEKPELTKKIFEVKSKIEKCLNSFLAKNIEIHKEFSDSEITTDEDQSDKDKKKTLKHIEMDYVVKKINGKKINDCFKKLGDRNIEFFKSFNIEDNEYYNLCFEMTVQNDDVKSKKIFQLYKYASWINLLHEITNLIINADKDVKPIFNQLLNKIKIGYGLLDYKCKTILIIVCNGNKEKFNSIQESINDKKNKTKFLKQLTEECKNKLNLYIDYYSFQYIDNSEINNLYQKEKKERQNEKIEYEKKLIQLQKEIEKYSDEIKENKKENLREKEKQESKINQLENQIEKERAIFEKKMDEAKSEFSKERAIFEKKMDEAKSEFSKERAILEKKMNEAKSEFLKDKEKYESIISEAKNEIDEAKNEIRKEREKRDKCNESLIAYLGEKNELNSRIFKLEYLLKQNNIPY